MSLKTKLLELFKYEPETDGAQTFNIKSALNDNWDKIEAWAQSVKTALTKLVPTSRKVNGKALSADVTLTAADIKMPNSEEDVGTAMAKRLMANGNVMRQGIIGSTLDDEYFASVTGTRGGGFFECYKDYTQRTQLVISSPNDTPLSARIAQTADGTHWTSKLLATCETPEVHELPLAAGWTKFDATCRYYKTQESIVIVSIAARTTQSFRMSAALATLPEGFRPAADLEVPAIFKGSRRLVTIKATADGNLFVDLTDQSGVAITSDDYFFATFAFMS